MKVRKKYVWLSIALIGILVTLYAVYEYNRKPADLSSMRAAAEVESAKLIALYESDEARANAMYLGKPIDVTGIVAEVNNQHDTIVNIFLGGPEDMHRVSCLLDLKHARDARRYTAGTKITVRGICTGYLMDVELNRCVIIR